MSFMKDNLTDSATYKFKETVFIKSSSTDNALRNSGHIGYCFTIVSGRITGIFKNIKLKSHAK